MERNAGGKSGSKPVALCHVFVLLQEATHGPSFMGLVDEYGGGHRQQRSVEAAEETEHSAMLSFCNVPPPSH